MSRRIRVKPGKVQSMAGLIGGVLFVFIGLFVVIPTFGPFGIIWTLFAVVITVMNGINAFSDRGVASHEIIVDDGNKVETSNYSQESKTKTPEERLDTLQRLYDKGTITYEEYQERRREILKDI